MNAQKNTDELISILLLNEPPKIVIIYRVPYCEEMT